jgi:hypothetical protein
MFLENVYMWCRVDNGVVSIRYQAKGNKGWHILRLDPSQYEVIICDPAYEGMFGTAFDGKNIKGGGE